MRIGIANDTPFAVEALRRVLSQRRAYRIAWIAHDGQEAVEFCVADTPDVVLMDLVMPTLDGVEATRQIMARAPCPILIVTFSIGTNASRVYEAMGAGALDAVDTPTLAGGDPGRTADALFDKIEQIARLGWEGAPAGPVTAERHMASDTRRAPLIAIGASAGGPAALAVLLADLPADFHAAIVIIQHVDQAFAKGMADWLSLYSKVPVRLAREGDRPLPGVALLAGTNDHLHFASAGVLGYTAVPLEVPHRPSVDVFFESVAGHWPGRAIGVLLTGMGRDGARGLKAMRANGYYTIAQDAASCAVYGMPKAAAEMAAASVVLPLTGIAPALVQHV